MPKEKSRLRDALHVTVQQPRRAGTAAAAMPRRAGARPGLPAAAALALPAALLLLLRPGPAGAQVSPPAAGAGRRAPDAPLARGEDSSGRS